MNRASPSECWVFETLGFRAEHYAKKNPELANFYKSKAEWTTKELAKIADESERKKIKNEVSF